MFYFNNVSRIRLRILPWIDKTHKRTNNICSEFTMHRYHRRQQYAYWEVRFVNEPRGRPTCDLYEIRSRFCPACTQPGPSVLRRHSVSCHQYHFIIRPALCPRILLCIFIQYVVINGRIVKLIPKTVYPPKHHVYSAAEKGTYA